MQLFSFPSKPFSPSIGNELEKQQGVVFSDIFVAKHTLRFLGGKQKKMFSALVFTLGLMSGRHFGPPQKPGQMVNFQVKKHCGNIVQRTNGHKWTFVEDGLDLLAGLCFLRLERSGRTTSTMRKQTKNTRKGYYRRKRGEAWARSR